MNEYNDKGEKHGSWESNHINGNLWYKENYINGKKHGLYEIYYYNGNLDYKVNYVNKFLIYKLIQFLLKYKYFCE